MSLSHGTGAPAISTPLTLRPPPDNTKAILTIAIGIAASLVFFMLTRNNLPHVGDNIHSLPHGGSYIDGTKSINYRPPASRYPSSNLLAFAPPILAAVLFFLTQPYLATRRSRCVRCFVVHGACTNHT
uniref:Movement protein TGB2 n=1 Tax=Foxtail mosaic virus TaxID=12179 RepID=TGB2_FXMV|nr:RecName: Full=Movement protein TGB2; AltName: Full=12 kDa protein; AltName: Full=Triple gene block 2 protein; Short=TGBp2 [Foxtail mosaic virus]ABW25050.1 14K protein [Foxtail mosaic virus]ABW25056.1 14K protein [Foxtail mosaic virus]